MSFISAVCAPVLLSLVSASVAPAEPITIMVGDKRVDGSIFKTYANKWKLVGVAPDGSVKEMGVWSDNTRIGDIDGKPAIIRRQTWSREGGMESYVNIVDQESMTPILSQYLNSGGLYYRFEYRDGGKSVRFQRSPQLPTEPGKPFKITEPMEQGDIQLNSPMFEFNAGMFGLLVAAFPLEAEFSARFPVFNIAKPSKDPAWIDFHVLGKEVVQAGPAKKVETWSVIVNSPATDEVMRFNLIKEPPYIIRLRQEWEGRDWTFEML